MVARGEAFETEDADETEEIDEGLLADAQALGIDPQSLIDQGHAKKEAQTVFYLLPENVPSFTSFFSVFTQWATESGMNGSRRTGLRYEGVLAAFRVEGLHGRKLAERFADIQVMEKAYLDERAKVAT